MSVWQRRYGWLLALWLLPTALARAEQVEIVTYYPAPAAAATDTEPPKPFTLTFTALMPGNAPGGPRYVLDMYAFLELWRYGVSRSQMSLVTATEFGGGRLDVWWRTSFSNGVFVIHSTSYDSSIIYNKPLTITVTW